MNWPSAPIRALLVALVILAVASAPAAGSDLARSGLSVSGLAAASIAGKPAPPPGGFVLPATNGYRIFVASVIARKGNPAVVALVVLKKEKGAIYVVPATVTETSFEANLGALGEIAVTFNPSGSQQIVRSKCGEEPISFAAGTYEGKIEFHGEEGYSAVEATQAVGDISYFANLICLGSSGLIGPPYLPGAELDVNPDSQSGPHLKVVKNRPSARAHFEAEIYEQHEEIEISRFIAPIEPSGTFRFDSRLKTAIVRPPAPFSGSARFLRFANPLNRWHGDLTVDLPGRDDVELSKGHMRASLAHAHWDWHP